MHMFTYVCGVLFVIAFLCMSVSVFKHPRRGGEDGLKKV